MTTFLVAEKEQPGLLTALRRDSPAFAPKPLFPVLPRAPSRREYRGRHLVAPGVLSTQQVKNLVKPAARPDKYKPRHRAWVWDGHTWERRAPTPPRRGCLPCFPCLIIIALYAAVLYALLDVVWDWLGL